MKYALFGVVCAAVVVFFHQGPSGNGESRMLTVFSLVEEHRLIADSFDSITQDKAIVGRHYYSEKAPLSSYVVLPFYWLYRQFATAKFSRDNVEAANHIAIAVAAALPFAVFAALLWWRGARDNRSRDTVWFALLAAFSSFVIIYANSYFGHVLGGTCLLSSYVLSIDRKKNFGWAGFFAGCAVATDYPLFIGVVLILWALLRGEDKWRRIGWFLVGAIAPAALFFAHNKAITGHFWDLPVSHVVDTWKPFKTAFGFRPPQPFAIFSLSVSAYRGVFFYAPLLILLCPILWLEKRYSLWILIAMWIYNVCYYAWDAGWCTGPRYLTAPVMLCLYDGLGAFCDRPRRVKLFVALGVFGVLLNTLFAATNPLPSVHHGIPLFRDALPDLFAGRMNAHNLMTELLHVAPRRLLLLVWLTLIAAIGFVFTRRRFDSPAAPP